MTAAAKRILEYAFSSHSTIADPKATQTTPAKSSTITTLPQIEELSREFFTSRGKTDPRKARPDKELVATVWYETICNAIRNAAAKVLPLKRRKLHW